MRRHWRASLLLSKPADLPLFGAASFGALSERLRLAGRLLPLGTGRGRLDREERIQPPCERALASGVLELASGEWKEGDT